MAVQSNAPVIIKRKKVISGGGHHGGAWKVAYADFVTAMMAFFMLMWLLNATTETQRNGIADYFTPTIPFSQVSGGGNGTLGGDTVFSEDTMMRTGTGGSAAHHADDDKSKGDAQGGDESTEALEKPLTEVVEFLTGNSGESTVSDDLLRHIVTRVTDEGLIVDLFDLPNARLFEDGTAEPTPLMIELTEVVAEVFELATNDVAVNGHVRSVPIVVKNTPVWDKSAARAQMTRELMAVAGLAPSRVQRIAGFADRKPTHPNLMDVRNNRIELILLR